MIQSNYPIRRIDPRYRPVATFADSADPANVEPMPTQDAEEVRITVTFEMLSTGGSATAYGVAMASVGIAHTRGWEIGGYRDVLKDENIKVYRVRLWGWRR